MLVQVIRAVALFTSVLLIASPQSQDTQRQQSYVLFALQGPILDPIAVVTADGFSSVPDDCTWVDYPSPDFAAFATSYLKPGRKYNLAFRGAKAGSVVIKPQDKASPDVLVEFQTRAPIDRYDTAIATNAAFGREVGIWRAPKPTEEKALFEQAKRIMMGKQVPDTSFGRLRLLRLIASDIDSDNKVDYLASFFIEREDGGGVEHTLFFLQEEGQGGPDFVHYAHAESEVEGTTVVPVDHVDLDGDGLDEVITRLTYYENYRYQIYRRSRGDKGWQRIFETETLGCL